MVIMRVCVEAVGQRNERGQETHKQGSSRCSNGGKTVGGLLQLYLVGIFLRM